MRTDVKIPYELSECSIFIGAMWIGASPGDLLLADVSSVVTLDKRLGLIKVYGFGHKPCGSLLFMDYNDIC